MCLSGVPKDVRWEYGRQWINTFRGNVNTGAGRRLTRVLHAGLSADGSGKEPGGRRKAKAVCGWLYAKLRSSSFVEVWVSH